MLAIQLAAQRPLAGRQISLGHELTKSARLSCAPVEPLVGKTTHSRIELAFCATSAMEGSGSCFATGGKANSMQRVPDLTNLPTVIESLMRPWVDAVETAPIGMGPIVASAAGNTSASLKRRVNLTADANAALTEALNASDRLAQKLEKQAPAIDERKATLAALAVLIDRLRASQPSDSTRALGLGW